MKKLAIHIVQDEIIIATDMEDMLNELGHCVVDVSKSYEEMIQKLPADKSDMFLVDIALRGSKSGMQIGETLRSMDIPHVYISSQEEREVLDKAKHGTIAATSNANGQTALYGGTQSAQLPDHNNQLNN